MEAYKGAKYTFWSLCFAGIIVDEIAPKCSLYAGAMVTMAAVNFDYFVEKQNPMFEHIKNAKIIRSTDGWSSGLDLCLFRIAAATVAARK